MKPVVITLALLSLSIASPGAAGDADNFPLLVNMTPDGSDDAARECATSLRRFLRSDIGDFQARGESHLRSRVVRAGDAGAATSDFFDWGAAALDTVATDLYYDGGSLVFFDCRPTEQIFRAIIVPQGPGNVRVQLRGPLMTNERALSALRTLMAYSGIGWQP